MPPYQNQGNPQGNSGQSNGSYDEHSSIQPPPGGWPGQPHEYASQLPQPAVQPQHPAGGAFAAPGAVPGGQYPASTAATPVQQPGTYPQPPATYPGQPPAYPAPGVYAQQPATPAQDTNPYGFFLDQTPTGKTSMLGAGGSSMITRILVVLVGLVGLLIGGFFVASLLFKTPDNAQRLLAVATTQQELIRVSDLGSKNVDDSRLQNFALTSKLSLTSSQQQLVSFLGKIGTEVDPKVLSASADNRTDAALKASESANTYDSTFASIMQRNLKKYEGSLKQAIQASTSRSEKELLLKQHAGALLLMKQLGPVE